MDKKIHNKRKTLLVEFPSIWNPIRTLFAGVIVIFFLLIYTPFEIKNIPLSLRIFTSLGFAIIVSGTIFLLNLLTNNSQFLKRLIYSHTSILWTIIRFNLLLLLIIGLFVFVYTFSIGFSTLTVKDFFGGILSSFLVGLLPIGLFILFDYHLKINQDSRIPVNNSDNKTIKLKEEIKKIIELKGENGNIEAKFEADTLLFIKGEGNYTKIHTINEHILLRNTIGQIEKQLTDYSNLYRSHKSYIVNIEKIDSYKGNPSKGYLLKDKANEFMGKISPNYLSLIESIKKR